MNCRSAAAAAAFLLAIAAVPARATVATWQQGVSGYVSCRSVMISTLNGVGAPGSFNDNGTTFGDGINDWAVGDMPNIWGANFVVLLRFDDLGLPLNAIVNSASLTLKLRSDYAGGRMSGRYLARPWNANFVDNVGGLTNAPVGWRYADKPLATSWTSLGAVGSGDLIAGSPFLMPTGNNLPFPLEQTVTVPLDVAIVQQWVATPSSNHGVRLNANIPDQPIYYVQPQRTTTATRHPKLTIDYTVPVGVEDEIANAALRLDVAPNPFRSRADVRFTLARGGDVRLTLHDLQGREIARLADGERAAGPHEAQLSSRALRPGLYFLRLESVGVTHVRRIALTP